jgi:hypothetical protein
MRIGGFELGSSARRHQLLNGCIEYSVALSRWLLIRIFVKLTLCMVSTVYMIKSTIAPARIILVILLGDKNQIWLKRRNDDDDDEKLHKTHAAMDTMTLRH